MVLCPGGERPGAELAIKAAALLVVRSHVSPYGTFDLDMEARLDLDWREAA